MKEFSQEFYNWLLNEKEEAENNYKEKNKHIGYYVFVEAIDKVIKFYKEICFRKDDENG